MYLQKEVWAVICGAIRNEFELNSILLRLVLLKRECKIEGIVLSTWLGELDNIDGLRSRLHQLKIPIIETPEITGVNNPYDLLYKRQATQLNAALKCIPDDVFILKCRTDFSIDYVNYLMSHLDKVVLNITNKNKYNFRFKYKILLCMAGISSPFTSVDISFFGHKQDIYKMITFESPIDLVDNEIPPDCYFFLCPFLREYSVLKNFYGKIRFWEFNEIMKNLPKINKEFKLPSLISKVYAEYFTILCSCFNCYDPEYKNQNTTLNDLFFKENGNCLTTNWIKSISDTRVLEKIFKMEIKNKKTEQLIKFVKMLNNNDEINLTTQDYMEFELFLINTVNYDPKRIIIDYPKMYVHQTKPTSETIFDTKTDIIMKNIVCSNNYYTTLKENLNQIQDLNSDLFEMGLITCSRTMDDNILKKISKMLYENNINKKNINAAKFIFERWGIQDQKLFLTPASSDRLIANYYYSMYSIKYCDIFSNKFAKMLCEMIELPPKYSISEIIDIMTIEMAEKESMDPSDTCKKIVLFLSEILYNDNSEDGIKQFRMGTIYKKGKYIEKNIGNAEKWIRKSIHNGIDWAAIDLFDLIYEKNDAESDDELMQIIEPLAITENTGAMIRLGCMYKYGRGTDTNMEKAIFWLKKADKKGDKWAEAELNEISP